jgi:hypothetical protein
MEEIVSFTTRPNTLPTIKNCGAHCIGDWVVASAGQDVLEERKLLRLPEFQNRIVQSVAVIAIRTALLRLLYRVCTYLYI